MGLGCQPARCRIAWKRQGGEVGHRRTPPGKCVARIWARDDNAALGCWAATGCREGVSFLQGQARGQRRPAWGEVAGARAGQWRRAGPQPLPRGRAGRAGAAGSPGYQRCRIPAELLAPAVRPPRQLPLRSLEADPGEAWQVKPERSSVQLG